MDKSAPLKVTREVDLLQLKKLAEALTAFCSQSPEKVEWQYTCRPPEVIRQGNSNAPAYLPDKPKVEELAQWIAFHGVEMLLEDTFGQAVIRARYHDKECRSENFEKFDDETFVSKQSWCSDTATKAELERQRMELIECMSRGVLPDGTPLSSKEDYARAHKMFVRLNERIAAKSRQ